MQIIVLYFINDLPDQLKSRVRLFADDAIIYLTVQSDADADHLQQDLNKLSEWTSKWMMELNTNKCEVITVTRKRKRIVHQYKLNDAILTPVEATKYLGVTITSDLKWNSHISNVCQKANNTLAFLRRNLRMNSPKLKATAN